MEVFNFTINTQRKMKQFMIALFVAALTACEPVAERYSIGTVYTAGQLDISVSPIVVDGKQSNKIILKNNTPILGEWNYGTGVSRLPVDTVLILRKGNVNITFNGLNADGSEITKTQSVTVEELSFAIPAEWQYLCGPTGEKEWTWDETWEAVWAESGYRIAFMPDDPDWWWYWMTPEELDEYIDPGYGRGASMTFSIVENTVFARTSGDGALSETGSFSLDMNKITYAEDEETVWAKGKLYLYGSTILCGKIPAGGDYETMSPVYEFDILELNEDRLVLAAAPPGSEPWWPAYFWIFKPESE
jgi:hypothetical protein